MMRYKKYYGNSATTTIALYFKKLCYNFICLFGITANLRLYDLASSSFRCVCVSQRNI